ncbi:MAG: YicC/YloC family endoribonuclease [Acidobacteriota bacterium]
MTGFASVSREVADAHVNITVKSVNHRFLDVVVKAPQSLASVEGRVRTLAQQHLTRGRVEFTLSADVARLPEREVVLDERLLASVIATLHAAQERGLFSGALTTSDVLRIPQVLEIRSKAPDAGGTTPSAPLAEAVDAAVTAALDALIVMRETEGRFIAADIEARLATIAGFVETLVRESGDGQRRLEEKLRQRVADLPADLQGDPGAIAQEIVRHVTRSDIDEEIVRLHGHLEHWRALATGPEPCGRKLDFLVQEMNREINTVGSKVEGAGATETVIAAKAELERVREQVQNVE